MNTTAVSAPVTWTFTIFAGGIGAQAGVDLVDQEFSGFGAYGTAGAVRAGLGAGISVVAGVATSRPRLPSTSVRPRPEAIAVTCDDTSRPTAATIRCGLTAPG